MKRISPLLQMSLALVALCGTLLLLADVLFGLFPDRLAQTMAIRKGVAESMAVQVASLLDNDDRRILDQTLQTVLSRTGQLHSLAVRRTDGSLVAQAGDHGRHWRSVDDPGRSSLQHLFVPLRAGAEPWGSFEMAFAADEAGVLRRWLGDPLVVLMLFVMVAGTGVFSLYLRRALQHLDPASVIPERVQGAFDAMHEGVVVLDVRGRALLTNKAFRHLHPGAAVLSTGHELSSLAWIASGLPEDPAAHPWARAMDERKANAGHTVEVGDDGDQVRRLVINASPITDPSGQVRGCLTTFNDVSDLHRANEALRDALEDLSRARDEMQLKNIELERLSTRDPLSGCLNRRAFFAAAEPCFRQARDGGTPFACLMMDIDFFKRVNDGYGHGVGDRVIQEVAARLMASARPVDLVCRYGGEEFCLVLPDLDRDAAVQFADRIRARIARECAAAIPEAEGLKVTVSIGYAVIDPQREQRQGPRPKTLVDMIEHADRGLYHAKRTGRNRVAAGDDAPGAETEAEAEAEGAGDPDGAAAKAGTALS